MASLFLVLIPAEQMVDMPTRRVETSLADMLLYKGHENEGVLGSRITPWDETVTVIQEHPWFGSGFGTSLTTGQEDIGVGQYSTVVAATHEHGNSYLAAIEGVGLLGVAPLFCTRADAGIEGRACVGVAAPDLKCPATRGPRCHGAGRRAGACGL